MDKPIKLLDYAKNVEYNRRRLVNYCQNHGQNITIADSLSNITTAVERVAPEIETDLYYVKCVDYDGTEIMPVQYVQEGAAVAEPTTIPTFDSEYLEFVKWQSDCDLNNIVHNTYIMPVYQTKLNADGVRPMIYKFSLRADYTGLTVCLRYSKQDTSNSSYSPTSSFNNVPLKWRQAIYAPNTDATIKVDWGDGSEIEDSSVTGKYVFTHTYATDGDYVIQVWGSRKAFSFASSNYAFGADANTSKSTYGLTAVYFGDFIIQPQYWCSWSSSTSTSGLTLPNVLLDLKYFIIPPNPSIWLNRGWFNYLGQSGIEYLVIPTDISLGYDEPARGNFHRLKALVYPWDRLRDASGGNGSMASLNLVSSGSSTALPVLEHLYYPTNPVDLTDLTKTYSCNYTCCRFLTKPPKIFGNATSVSFSYCANLKTIADIPPITPNYTIGTEACYALTEYIIPKGVTAVNQNYLIRSMPNCKRIIFLGNTSITHTMPFDEAYSVQEIMLPSNYKGNINMYHCYNLRITNLINMAQQVADLSESGEVYALTFHRIIRTILENTYINSDYMQVKSTDTDAHQLLQVFLDKGWTISYYV